MGHGANKNTHPNDRPIGKHNDQSGLPRLRPVSSQGRVCLRHEGLQVLCVFELGGPMFELWGPLGILCLGKYSVCS